MSPFLRPFWRSGHVAWPVYRRYRCPPTCDRSSDPEQEKGQESSTVDGGGRETSLLRRVTRIFPGKFSGKIFEKSFRPVFLEKNSGKIREKNFRIILRDFQKNPEVRKKISRSFTCRIFRKISGQSLTVFQKINSGRPGKIFRYSSPGTAPWQLQERSLPSTGRKKSHWINIGTLIINRISSPRIDRALERSGKVFPVPAWHAVEVEDAFTMV